MGCNLTQFHNYLKLLTMAAEKPILLLERGKLGDSSWGRKYEMVEISKDENGKWDTYEIGV